MTWPHPVRVIGVGSPWGDDAVGWEVVRRLQREKAWGSETEFHTVEGGQRLLDVLDGQGTLLLIDALAPAGSPGAIRRFEWPDQRVEVLRPGTTHHLRPAEALRLAETLGTLPPRAVVFGIEAASLDPHRTVCRAVDAAVPELVRRIVSELEAG